MVRRTDDLETAHPRGTADGSAATPLPESMTGRASPAKAATGDKPVFAYLASLPQPQQGIAERVDALAAATLPDLQRSIKWGMAYYGVGDGMVLQLRRVRRPRQADVRQRRDARPGATHHPGGHGQGDAGRGDRLRRGAGRASGRGVDARHRVEARGRSQQALTRLASGQPRNDSGTDRVARHRPDTGLLRVGGRFLVQLREGAANGQLEHLDGERPAGRVGEGLLDGLLRSGGRPAAVRRGGRHRPAEPRRRPGPPADRGRERRRRRRRAERGARRAALDAGAGSSPSRTSVGRRPRPRRRRSSSRRRGRARPGRCRCVPGPGAAARRSEGRPAAVVERRPAGWAA